ncbi:MAG: hypothetical protein JJU00_13105 [Opitutales bacterium]|nr:hypothetical protein [Opitutales bacterium]
MSPDSLTTHPLFEAFTDPHSGVVSHVLKAVIAPIQQTFYYTNPSLTADERWLWIMTAWPPAPSRTLGLVCLDPGNPVVRHFPQAQFPGALPLVAPDGGVWFGAGAGLYHMSQDGEVRQVFKLPEEYIKGRELRRLATHLSLSSDGKYLLLDGQVGDHWFVGTAALAGGEFRLIREFASHHNHALFSPVHPDLFTIAHDQFRHPVTGEFTHHTERTHLMDVTGNRYECVNSQFRCSPFHGACHEWWSGDGRICYIDYDTGAYEYDLDTGITSHVWREPLCHAHCSGDRRWWCADESPYKWREQPCKVLLYNRLTQARIEVRSAMPMPSTDYWETRRVYHIDPHPQISPRGNYVVYTAIHRGQPSAALCPIEDGIRQALA